ncbi:MAG: phosphoribosyltransferase [Gammaproteobacteria bacterium]|nr:phosphoribosyltransferase [Gammaproteobacteria bacterium]
MDRFIDRTSAGEALAKQLLLDQPAKNSLIAGLVRGGIPVASAVANELSLPLDIILVRKLGFPQHQELAMGAITADGNYVLNDFVTNSMQVAPEIINNVIKQEMVEMKRRAKRYHCEAWQTDVHARPVILVDDGIATGATMQAAVQSMKRQGADPISIAVPVIAESAITLLKPLVANIYYLHTLEPYNSVGAWYENFAQVNDEQVCELLQQHGLIKNVL